MQVARTVQPFPLPEAFAHALEALGPFEPKPHIAVAVSGGSDSMALTLLAHEAMREAGGRIAAITVDHGLRPESKQEAEHVAAVLQARGIDHVILTPPHNDAGNNLMNAARQWRYDALTDWCAKHSMLHCLLGHHAGDQRETIALHMARGETADGPSGMRSVRNYSGVRFLRPLLGCEKGTLQHYLRERGVPWIDDPTNSNVRFARNRLRGRPLTPAIATDRAAREQRVARAAAQCVTISPDGKATLALAFWRTLPTSVAEQLLADLVRTIGGAAARPRKHKTLAAAQALRGDEPVARTLGGCTLRTRGGELHIEREKARITGAFRPAKPLAASPFW